MRTLSFLRLALTGAVLTVALIASGCGSTTSSSGGTTDTGTTEDTGAGSDAASSDTSTDTTTGTDTTAGTDTTSGVSFSTIYPKMAATCAASGCHTTKDAKFSGKLDLSAQDTAYAALVTSGTADGVCGPTLRVKAGDHANSSLWIRLNPTATTCGGADTGKMPSGGTPYTTAELAAVAAWIDAGAAK